MRIGRVVAGVALIAAAAVAGGGWRRPAVAAPPAALPEVLVAAPVIATVPDIATYPAHLEAVQRVELRPRVSGHLQAVLFADGASVRKGQMLASIDARPFRVALLEAEAGHRRAQAEAEMTRKEAERAARLLARQATSVEESEQLAASAEVASAQLAAAEAAVARARLDLTYTELRAPLAGRVGRAELTVGNLVGPESRIATIVALDPLYVRFDVDEATAVRQGGRAWQIRLRPTGHTEGLAAKLAFLDPEVAAGTGTRRARALVDNPRAELAPGMYGRAEVTFGHHAGSLLIDEHAVGTDQGQRFVLAVGANDTLEYRPVWLGARHGALRVVTDGLVATDRVVVNGLARVRPGMQIRPVAAAAASEGK